MRHQAGLIMTTDNDTGNGWATDLPIREPLMQRPGTGKVGSGDGI